MAWQATGGNLKGPKGDPGTDGAKGGCGHESARRQHQRLKQQRRGDERALAIRADDGR